MYATYQPGSRHPYQCFTAPLDDVEAMYGLTGSGKCVLVLNWCVLLLHASMPTSTHACPCALLTTVASQLHAEWLNVLHQGVGLQVTPWCRFVSTFLRSTSQAKFDRKYLKAAASFLRATWSHGCPTLAASCREFIHAARWRSWRTRSISKNCFMKQFLATAAAT
jgi:hypothetical protein